MGDAEELPFDDDQFDIYTIAFGIRNVTHIEQVKTLHYIIYDNAFDDLCRFVSNMMGVVFCV